MFLFPKKTKFSKSYCRKQSSLKYQSQKVTISNGFGCLLANENSFLAFQQINIALKLIKKKINKQSKIWTSFAPNFALTQKPSETRMGKGKGSIKCWVFVVSKNEPIFEFSFVNKNLLFKITNFPKTNLPLKSSLLFKY